MKLVDRVGERFGYLVVLHKSPQRARQGQAKWVCRCDCGVEVTVTATNLRDGNTRSCGCQRAALRGVLPDGESGFRCLLYQYRLRASKKGLAFDLDEERFRALTQLPCHYCAAPPSQRIRNGHQRTTYVHNGVDRKDNDLGYTFENSVTCCKTCNWAKNSSDYNGFLAWVASVYVCRISA